MLIKSNKALGNAFEREFCEELASKGFWVHNMAQNKDGQPADVIAVIDGYPFLIDCKVCAHDKFPLKRIEENQRNAMEFWRKRGNGTGWFAMKTSAGTYMVSMKDIEQCIIGTGCKQMNLNAIETYGYKLDVWEGSCRFLYQTY